MADVVIGAIVFLAVCAIVWVAVRAYNSRLAPARPVAEVPWKLDERQEEGADERPVLSVYCVRPGEKDFLVGSAVWGDSDFESQIEEVRDQGYYKLAALNRPLPKRRS